MAKLRSRARLLERPSIRYSVIVLLLAVFLPVYRAQSPPGVLVFGSASPLSWWMLVWTVGIAVVTFVVWRQSKVLAPLVPEGRYDAARSVTRRILPFSLAFGLVVGLVVYLTYRQLDTVTARASGP